jgi:hypothetical protein
LGTPSGLREVERAGQSAAAASRLPSGARSEPQTPRPGCPGLTFQNCIAAFLDNLEFTRRRLAGSAEGEDLALWPLARQPSGVRSY